MCRVSVSGLARNAGLCAPREESEHPCANYSWHSLTIVGDHQLRGASPCDGHASQAGVGDAHVSLSLQICAKFVKVV